MKELVYAWIEYTKALIEREKNGGAHYDDFDFTFDKFMDWYMNTHD